jgi:glucoamylase
METIDTWLGRQYAHAATEMLASVSPCATIMTRAPFGQTIRPVKGAIVASPVPGAYDPDPDYFFHWYRDSAVVMDAMRVLYMNAAFLPGLLVPVADFARFSLALQDLDGRAIVKNLGRRDSVAPKFRQFLRADEELAAVHGDRIASDTRVNPDGSLDILRWARPQHDGSALRALAMLRWKHDAKFEASVDADIVALVKADLAYTLRHSLEPSFDIWEEESGLHYYTLCISAAALEAGGHWLEECAEPGMANACRVQAGKILAILDDYWLENEGYYRSRAPVEGSNPAKALDIAVILASLHGGRTGMSHSVHDPRMHATLSRLDELFGREYAINRDLAADRQPAMGRYAGDKYFAGGAYYFSTLAAAEFCYRAGLLARGDGYLRTVQAYTPQNGNLSEQFDQNTGQQTSAPRLAWSYAAFITCVAARRALNPPGAAGNR